MLPDRFEAEVVEPTERSEIGCKETMLGHVEVFRTGSVELPSSGRPRPYPGTDTVNRLHPRSRSATEFGSFNRCSLLAFLQCRPFCTGVLGPFENVCGRYCVDMSNKNYEKCAFVDRRPASHLLRPLTSRGESGF